MTETEIMDRKHREDLQRIRGFRLLDDDFLTKCFDRKTDCMELVLQIVLENPDLQVVDVRTQVFVEFFEAEMEYCRNHLFLGDRQRRTKVQRGDPAR